MIQKIQRNTKVEAISNLSDTFEVKNFVLTDNSDMQHALSLNHPFIFDGLVFGICLKGNARMRVNFRDFAVEEGMIMSILPKQIFKTLSHSPDFLVEVLFLASDYALRLTMPKDIELLKRIEHNPVQTVNAEVMHDLLELHALVAKHHHRESNPYREHMTRSLIHALMIAIASVYALNKTDQISDKAHSRQEYLTDRFFELLLENYVQERTVTFYADKMCLTPKYLSTTVKKITGHSIQEWINEAVVIEAKTRLKTTDHTVLQISEELNFPNPSFFGRFFKQYVGMTPLKYRNE